MTCCSSETITRWPRTACRTPRADLARRARSVSVLPPSFFRLRFFLRFFVFHLPSSVLNWRGVCQRRSPSRRIPTTKGLFFLIRDLFPLYVCLGETPCERGDE